MAIAGQNISQKRASWNSLSRMWAKQNKFVPEYYPIISSRYNNTYNENPNDIHLLYNSMNLDNFRSKSSILKYYNKKLTKDKIAEMISSKLKKLLCKLIKG